jgi:proline iminopeptidase
MMRLIWMCAALVACATVAPVATPTHQLVAATLTSGEHAVIVDAVAIAYEVRGHGPVCLALPDVGMDRTIMKSSLFEAHFTMVYFDPIGTGASGHLPEDEAYSIARDVEVVEGLRKQLGLERLCLIGHGYGGWVAERYAVEYSQSVSALVLYSTTPATTPDWDRVVSDRIAASSNEPWFGVAMAGVEAERHAKNEASYLRALEMEAPLFFVDWYEHRDSYSKAVGRVHISLEVLTRREGAPFNLRPELRKVSAPTLVITGEQDVLGGPEPSYWIADAITNATLVVIPKAGVFAHIEQPAAFERALAEFDRVQPSRSDGGPQMTAAFNASYAARRDGSDSRLSLQRPSVTVRK